MSLILGSTAGVGINFEETRAAIEAAPRKKVVVPPSTKDRSVIESESEHSMIIRRKAGRPRNNHFSESSDQSEIEQDIPSTPTLPEPQQSVESPMLQARPAPPVYVSKPRPKRKVTYPQNSVVCWVGYYWLNPVL